MLHVYPRKKIRFITLLLRLRMRLRQYMRICLAQ